MLELQAELRRQGFALALSLRAEPGACLALAGPSGAGKSTVLGVAAGLVAPARGQVSCSGQTWLDTTRALNVAPERRGCGYLFQDYALFPHLSAWRNVAYGLRGRPRGERRERAHALLERFGLGGRAEARPAELSGGERQRVALARALAPRPRALLLDEPLSALDAATRAAATRELALLLREADVPALLVTHDFAEAAALGHRVGVMDRGRVVQEGTAAELAARPASAFVADFTGASVLRGAARRAARGLTAVALDGGGELLSTDSAEGRVAASVFPWEIAIETGDARPAAGSQQNRLRAEVLSVTELGNRTRLGLATPQPLAAEVTTDSARSLRLAPGVRVTATWKAAATRVVPV